MTANTYEFVEAFSRSLEKRVTLYTKDKRDETAYEPSADACISSEALENVMDMLKKATKTEMTENWRFSLNLWDRSLLDDDFLGDPEHADGWGLETIDEYFPYILCTRGCCGEAVSDAMEFMEGEGMECDPLNAVAVSCMLKIILQRFDEKDDIDIFFAQEDENEDSDPGYNYLICKGGVLKIIMGVCLPSDEAEHTLIKQQLRSFKRAGLEGVTHYDITVRH